MDDEGTGTMDTGQGEPRMCRDSRVAGAFNSDCPEVATHTLRRKPLCTKHWKDALNNDRKVAASQASYSQMLGYLSRRG